MKSRIIAFLAAAFALASCSRVSDTTVVTGYTLRDMDQIRITCADVDTVFYTSNGTFTIELPVDLTSVSAVTSPEIAVGFIADGSRITVDFRTEEPFAESSSKAQCAAFTAFQKSMYGLQIEYTESMNAISQEDIDEEERMEKAEKAFEAVRDKMVRISKKTVKSNRDNATALVALNNLSEVLESGELVSLIEMLDPQIQENPMVSSMLAVFNATAATAEGMMFKDFTVPYQGEKKSLSDYVGKGKYVLVDFWASWCAPCRAEMPNLKQVYEQYHGDNFDMLSVAVWDEPDASVAAAGELGISWNQIVNAQSVPTDLYGIEGIPHIILFGPDGTIVKRNLRGEEIGETVGKYVK